MRKLRIMEHISLDGVIQQSADDDDFPYGNWGAPYRTPAGRDALAAAHGGRYDLLLGRRTYDMWSGFWPKAPSSPMADGLNGPKNMSLPTARKVLNGALSRALDRTSSRTFAASSRKTARTLSSGVVPTLTSTLLEHGLADEVLLVVYPVLLGTGKRIFAPGTPPRSFELVRTNALPSGVILSFYKVVGPLKTE